MPNSPESIYVIVKLFKDGTVLQKKSEGWMFASIPYSYNCIQFTATDSGSFFAILLAHFTRIDTKILFENGSEMAYILVP